MATLLVIEDELVLAKNIARFFSAAGHTVEVANDGNEGVEMAKNGLPDVVIVDFQLPGLNGLEIIRTLRLSADPPYIVMMTGHASVSLAVDAMKAGSMDVLTKPVALSDLKNIVARALKERGARQALDYYRSREVRNGGVETLVGESVAMTSLRSLIGTVARLEPADQSAPAPVLIVGETGTGKELVARACHLAGPRSSGPFLEVNCAALPHHLIESELFGYEKGAFTDAQTRKTGLLEAADGGTLFLDEIGELDLQLQSKLLRVLENFRVRRLGAITDRQVNVRIITATNRDLNDMVRTGQFRADLLYRLKVFQIELPPLRAREGDIALLSQHFLELIVRRYGRAPVVLDASAIAALNQYHWPGNVRELRNVLERAVLNQAGERLTGADLQQFGLAAASVKNHAAETEGYSLNAVERAHLVSALEANRWNVSKAAKLLGISRDTLRYRMEKHGLRR